MERTETVFLTAVVATVTKTGMVINAKTVFGAAHLAVQETKIAHHALVLILGTALTAKTVYAPVFITENSMNKAALAPVHQTMLALPVMYVPLLIVNVEVAWVI